jgi:hypothetical membrane protein
MTHKHYALMGIFLIAQFWALYFIMAMARPEYSFLTKAISELGTVDAPNLWMWNILGYILTGVLIAVYSYGLFQSISDGNSNKLPMIAFIGSGLFMSLSGFFPGDMDNRTSLTTILHLVGSIGSYVCFLVAAFTYPKQMRKSVYWKKAITPTLAFTYLTILFGAWPYIFTNMPGAGQRLVFIFYFLWIFYTALMLYKQKAEEMVTVAS